MLEGENLRFLFPPIKYVASDINLNLLQCFDSIVHGLVDKV